MPSRQSLVTAVEAASKTRNTGGIAVRIDIAEEF